ncbi:MAG: hypothetical protein M1820_006597 [Bogoriella megaspora]|nr:MAG: hypothetical protein M1820_006597 [Bogoriella megaspora]
MRASTSMRRVFSTPKSLSQPKSSPTWVCRACRRATRPSYVPQGMTFTTTSRYLARDGRKPSATAETSQSLPPEPVDGNEEADAIKNEKSEIAQEEDYHYEPATTWKGLERVGGKGWLAKQKPRKHFEGFLRPRREQSNEEILAAIGIAIRSSGIQDQAEKETHDLSGTARDSQEEQSSGTVQGPTETSQASETAPVNPLLTEHDLEDFSLADPSTKFRVVKEVMVLTGIIPSDPLIQRCKTAHDLYLNFIQKPKPTKLAETLLSDPRLVESDNVSISAHKINLVDKERSIGRWKVIERELHERDLPVPRIRRNSLNTN